MRLYKSTLLAFVLALLCANVSAQITDRGNFLIGGTLGFSTASSSFEVTEEGQTEEGDSGNSVQFNFAPAIGYFFTDNLAIGIGLDYTLNTTTTPESLSDAGGDSDKIVDSDLLFGPYARYYFPVGEDKAFFVEGSFGIGNSVNDIEIDDQNQTTATSVTALGIGPGFTIFSNDAIGIEALAKYNWARSNTDIDVNGISTESTSFTNALDFSVGLQFYFTRLEAAR
ncbi:MAG: outer membrane beta-barrel protein [Bacteroidota bacterium]